MYVNDSLVKFQNSKNFKVEDGKFFTFVRVEWAGSAYTNVVCRKNASSTSLSVQKVTEMQIIYSKFQIVVLIINIIETLYYS